MFGNQDRPTWKICMKDLINTCMVDRTPIWDHVLKMRGLLSKMEFFGAEIDGEIEVGM